MVSLILTIVHLKGMWQYIRDKQQQQQQQQRQEEF